MGIYHKVVFGAFELREPSTEVPESALLALFSELLAMEGNDFVDRGVMGDSFDEAVLNHPINLGIREPILERSKYANRPADIA